MRTIFFMTIDNIHQHSALYCPYKTNFYAHFVLYILKNKKCYVMKLNNVIYAL
jgi:hypothetical protein